MSLKVENLLPMIELVKQGMPYEEIAEKLNITVRNVHYRIERYEQLTNSTVSRHHDREDKISDDWIEVNIIIPRRFGISLQLLADTLPRATTKQRVHQLQVRWEGKYGSGKIFGKYQVPAQKTA